MIDSLVWLLLLPLAWATLAFVLGPGRGAWLAIAGLAAQFALAVDLARKVAAGGVSAHVVGGWARRSASTWRPTGCRPPCCC